MMSWREWGPRLGVALGYVAVAIVFTWPLALHLGTRLTGDPGGDTGVYVWNQWVFQHETASGANPLSTQQIFSLSQRVDLSQHNYTAFLNLLALPLIPLVGVVAAFNLVLLITTVITALCAYRLARVAFPTTRVEAFVAGLAFAWSPVLVARTTGHFSLVAAAPARRVLAVRDPGRTHPCDRVRRARRPVHGVGGVLRSVFRGVLPDAHRPLRELAPRAHHPSRAHRDTCHGCGC